MHPSLAFKILRGTLLLFALVAVWCAVFWWLIAPDFAALSWPEATSLHVGPPLLFSGGWRFWVGYGRRRRSAAAEHQEKVVEQERTAMPSAAQGEHEKALRRRRFCCDCRAVAIAGVMDTAALVVEGFPAHDEVHFSVRKMSDAALDHSLQEHLEPAIEESLMAIYQSCPAALTFPVYLAPPADVGGEDVLTLVKAQWQKCAQSASGAFLPGAVPPDITRSVSFLPVRDSAADSVISILEDNLELPGLVVVAFDSPWWRAQREGVAFESEVANNNGPYSQGVFALALTRPELEKELSAVECSELSSAMTPYWEKERAKHGTYAHFERSSEATLALLGESRALARIHRAASDVIATEVAHRPLLAQNIEHLIEHAQINAAQVDLAFDVPSGETSSATESRVDCGWLVHNAGMAEYGGHRLASLGAALFRRGFCLNPISQASNACAVFGDVGCARQVALLALSVAQAAENQCGTLCADFDDRNRLSIFFVMAMTASA